MLIFCASGVVLYHFVVIVCLCTHLLWVALALWALFVFVVFLVILHLFMVRYCLFIVILYFIVAIFCSIFVLCLLWTFCVSVVNSCLFVVILQQLQHGHLCHCVFVVILPLLVVSYCVILVILGFVVLILHNFDHFLCLCSHSAMICGRFTSLYVKFLTLRIWSVMQCNA